MRIIIDTNILVSAFIFGGGIKRKLERILADKRIWLLTSIAINEELKEVLFRDKFQKFQEKKYRFFGNSRDEPGVLKRSFSGLWQAKRPASRATDPVFLPGSLDASQGQKQAKAPLQHS